MQSQHVQGDLVHSRGHWQQGKGQPTPMSLLQLDGAGIQA